MFDVEKLKEGREFVPPVMAAPLDFPYNDMLPEGCIEEDVPEDFGYNVQIHKDIVYASRDGWDLQLIILEPFNELLPPGTDDTKWPCLVYVNGSAWFEQNMWFNFSRHLRLAEKGYVVALVQYRPSTTAVFPAQIQDAKTAIRYVRKNADKYHIDADRIALGGDSSGGHTALMAGIIHDNPEFDTDLYSEYSDKVNCIVDLFGPICIGLMPYQESVMDHYEPNSPENFLFGVENCYEMPELLNKTVPMNYVDDQTPPILIMHGAKDMLVNFEQSLVIILKKMARQSSSISLNRLDMDFLDLPTA